MVVDTQDGYVRGVHTAPQPEWEQSVQMLHKGENSLKKGRNFTFYQNNA